MFLSKRKNGIYYIYYDQPNGKRTSKSTGTHFKSEALKYLSNFEQRQKEFEKVILYQTNLERFRFEFLKYSETIHSNNHTKSIKTTFNELIKHVGNLELIELTKDKFQEYIEYRLRNVSPYAVKRDIANLSSAFNWGISRKYLTNNPCNNVKKPKIPQKMPLFFSEVEFQVLLNSIENQDLRNLIEFASLTGLRQSDLLNLTWEQVNYKDRSIILDNRTSLTKSRKIHTLPLNLRALQILTERELTKTCVNVFTYFMRPVKQDFISKKFRKLVKEAKLNSELTFHHIRHSFASWLIKKRVSIYHVSKLLTHSDLRVTQIYTHLNSEDLRESINVLNENYN